MDPYLSRRLITTLTISIVYSLVWLILRKVLKLNATKTRLAMLGIMVLLVLALSQGWLDGLFANLSF